MIARHQGAARRRRAALGGLVVAAALGAALTVFSAGGASAQDACVSPSNTCGEGVESGCLTTLGAGAVAVDDATRRACEGALSGYRQCLVLVVQQCQSAETPKVDDAPAPPPEACPREIETRLWDAVKDSADPDLLRHFIGTCGGSALAAVAQTRLAALEAASAPNATAAAPAPVAAAPALESAEGLAACPRDFRGRSSALRCLCPAGPGSGGVWGSGPYTADSALCVAARHAGVIDEAGGAVEAAPAPGQASYAGTEQNGVSTGSWGAYRASFVFPGAPTAAELAADSSRACPSRYSGRAGALTCTCPAASATSGAVWGTGVYTADSSICRAALHAGVVGSEGGVVSLRAEPGQNAYIGTLNNGVRTSNWGPYRASFTFDGVEEEELASLQSICPANARHLRGGDATLRCDCPPGAVAGTVWGDGVYTDDSSICRAAVHAGRIDAGGGSVTLEILPGQEAYAGAQRNGVSTSSYGRWGGSYRFTGG